MNSNMSSVSRFHSQDQDEVARLIITTIREFLHKHTFVDYNSIINLCINVVNQGFKLILANDPNNITDEDRQTVDLIVELTVRVIKVLVESNQLCDLMFTVHPKISNTQTKQGQPPRFQLIQRTFVLALGSRLRDNVANDMDGGENTINNSGGNAVMKDSYYKTQTDTTKSKPVFKLITNNDNNIDLENSTESSPNAVNSNVDNTRKIPSNVVDMAARFLNRRADSSAKHSNKSQPSHFSDDPETPDAA